MTTQIDDSLNGQATHEEVADDVLVWDESDQPAINYSNLAKKLSSCGDLFRAPPFGSGLILAAGHPIEPIPVNSGRKLAAAIVDRVKVRVIKDGKPKGSNIPRSHLEVMLGSETFLDEFVPVDDIVRTPQYIGDFELTEPGYNHGGAGHRLIYVGPPASINRTTDTINRFLDVLEFASNSDRTNAVAAAFTTKFRYFWPGQKPAILATADKSHAGKDTTLDFAAGVTPWVEITHQATDWAFERSAVGVLNRNPSAGMLRIGNARLGRHERDIASAFLERFLTSPEVTLFSTSTGPARKIRNHIVVGISTNLGRVSTDLLNRSLPIHLMPAGNVHERRSPIGDPRNEYLPANRMTIDAELNGMIERWTAEGRPLDTQVRHPRMAWAQTVGGILMVNGYTDFLGNYGTHKTTDDPLRRAIGIMGAARLDAWLRAGEWAKVACDLGLVKHIVPEIERDSEPGRERAIGIVLSAHRDETFVVETDDEQMTLRLHKARRRFVAGAEPETRYSFEPLEHKAIPEDPPDGSQHQ